MDYINATDSELEQLVQQKDINAICELGERYLYGKMVMRSNIALLIRCFTKEKNKAIKEPIRV